MMLQALVGKVQNFGALSLYEKSNSIALLLCRLKGTLFYRHVFAEFGKKSYIERPEFISNPQYIHVGDKVSIRKGARLECVLDEYGRRPSIRIGSNVNIEQDVHIVCHNRIVIGDNVSITGRCAIVDVTHPYQDVRSRKIGECIVDDDSFVEISDGAFIGFAAVILPNVRIGRSAIIGANSVVTRDVPDYCIAAGAPARIVRRYREAT